MRTMTLGDGQMANTEAVRQRAGQEPATLHMCILHAEYHEMGPECWREAIAFYAAHHTDDLEETTNRYRWEVEQRMLSEITREHGRKPW